MRRHLILIARRSESQLSLPFKPNAFVLLGVAVSVLVILLLDSYTFHATNSNHSSLPEQNPKLIREDALVSTVTPNATSQLFPGATKDPVLQIASTVDASLVFEIPATLAGLSLSAATFLLSGLSTL